MSVRYPQEFKNRAVRLHLEQGMPIPDIARKLDVGYETVRVWVRKAQGSPTSGIGATESDAGDR
jgi:transposase-like protein